MNTFEYDGTENSLMNLLIWWGKCTSDFLPECDHPPGEMHCCYPDDERAYRCSLQSAEFKRGWGKDFIRIVFRDKFKNTSVLIEEPATFEYVGEGEFKLV